MALDRLIEAIKRTQTPTVAGLDPKLEYIPSHIKEAAFQEYGETLEGAAAAILAYNKGLIDALCDIVPAVKPQAAYYEMYGWPGVRTLVQTIAYAKGKGLFVITDGKRNDIGTTMEAYAAAHMGKTAVGDKDCVPFGGDALTVNGYLGSDGILPLIPVCREQDTGLFVLVKTSNPGSGELQDMVAGDRLVYQVMGDLNQRIAKGTEGKYGYTMAGAVTGATYPSDIRALRKRLEHTFFLVPGYGAQGGTAEDVQYAFDKYGHGAIVNSSRGIMCAWQKTGGDGRDFAQAARDAAIAMRDDIRRFVTIV